MSEAAGATDRVCDACGTSFAPAWAYQSVPVRGETRWACTTACRMKLLQSARSTAAGPVAEKQVRIAILNQKGGTGKTTTSVSLAAALAEEGKRVLVVDCDSQGHVAVSLGVRSERGLAEVLLGEATAESCVVSARERLDVLTGSELLAGAEIRLARMEGARDRVLRSRLAGLTAWEYVLLDCGPSQSLINTNALTYADGLIVPMACDFLSLVGVNQVLRTLRRVNEQLAHPVEILGVLPTFYDQRNRISDESIRTVRARFGDRVLPPIGISTRFKEAPAQGRTIFEHAPGSRGASDYRRLARWLIERSEGAAASGGASSL